MTPVWFRGIVLSMKEPDKPGSDKEPPSPPLARLEEVRRVIEEYASDLREIIRKLRQRLH
jgi:hypothetical protein